MSIITFKSIFFLLQWDEPYARYTQGLSQPLSDIDIFLCLQQNLSTCILSSKNENTFKVGTEGKCCTCFPESQQE